MPDVKSGRLTCKVRYFHTKQLFSEVEINQVIVYLFIQIELSLILCT